MLHDAPTSSRKLLRTQLWQNAELWRLWCWCWLSAARRLGTALVNQVPVRLCAGQVATTLEVMSEQTGLRPDVVRRNLAIGKNVGLLELRAAHWGLRITIVDWQGSAAHMPSPRP